MTGPLTPGHVRRYLEPLGLQVEELPADTSTAPLAAAALGTTVATIVKSLLFIADDAPVLVLAAGDRKVDRDLVARARKARSVRLAKPAEVADITGYPVGGVPPVAHAARLPVLMDRTLLDHPTVYAAAGAGNAIFAVAPTRLLEISGATVSGVTHQ